jgi:hypothetical protein
MAYHKSIAGIGGRIYLVPSGANPDKVQLAVVKSWNFDLTQEEIELRGSGLDSLENLPVKRTVKGKLSLSDFSTNLISAVTSGTTITAGSVVGLVQSASVPTTPFQVTVTQSATFLQDLGVIDLTAGKEMTEGATATGTGVYSVAAGVYTFNTADTGHAVKISYRHTAAASGKTLEVAAAEGGTAATRYELHVYGSAGGKSYGFWFPAVSIPNLSLSMSPDSYSDVSVDFSAFLSSTDKLMYAYLPE